jgi:ABC-type nitrate/sulfonate/bicarbonate transport system ATPase subunit
MLSVRDCTAAYDAAAVLESINLSVPHGATGCIIGPSGCGKTTLLMLAAGLKEPVSGSVQLDGEPVRAGDRRIGLILQQYGLFPWLTARENVALGLRLRHAPSAVLREMTDRELGRVGLLDCADRYPMRLSGGQQQRVAIARCMALAPRLLLMDEPFSALDALAREASQELLIESLAERDVAVLVVTHSIEEAVFLGSRIWVLAGRPGRIRACFENPGQGTSGYRQEPEYFHMCNEVRRAMIEARPQ